MAQYIKKLQQGGTSTPKRGTLTIDNVTYDIDDDNLASLYSHAKTLNTKDSGQFGNIINALLSGENISFDSTGTGTLTGNVNWNVSDKQNDRLKNNRTRVGTAFGKGWHGNEQSVREAISSLKGLQLKRKDDTPQRTVHDFSRELEGEYTTDENGNRSWINGLNNQAIITRLQNLNNILNYNDDVDDFLGYNNMSKDEYIRWINANFGKTAQDAMIEKLKSGQWSEEDELLLKNIGIILGKKRTAQGEERDAAAREQAENDKYTALGLDRSKHGNYVTIGNNGELYVTDAFNQLFGTSNGIYNDNWRTWLMDNDHWNPEFDWLRNNYTRIGNRLYQTNTMGVEGSDLYKYVHEPGGFYDRNRAGNYTGASQLLEYLWEQPDEWSTWDKNKYYNEWMGDRDPNTFRYRPLTGLYKTPEEGQQIIEFFNLDSPVDMFGRPLNYHYALFDKDGRFQRYLNYDKENNALYQETDIAHPFARIQDGQQQSFDGFPLIQDEGPYKGMYEHPIVDKNNSDSGWRLYRNPINGKTYLYSPMFEKYSNLQDKAMVLPDFFVDSLNKNPNFWTVLLSNPQLQDKFIRTLRRAVSSSVGETMRGGPHSWYGTNVLSADDYENLGFNNADELYNQLTNWKMTYIPPSRNTVGFGTNIPEGNRYSRINELLVPRYVPSEIPINQKGGLIGTTVDAKGKKSTEKVDKFRDAMKPADDAIFGKGDLKLSELSHADQLELASLATDIGALIASIPTGGNAVAAGLGYGSSLMQLKADVDRDGFQWRDLGNLAINLGLDTITFLPGAGIAGKMGKTIKTLKKSANVVRKGFLALGLTNATKSLNNLLSGNGTISDWKNVATGLIAVKGLKNEVQNYRATQRKGGTKIEAKTETEIRNKIIQREVDKRAKGNNDITKDAPWFKDGKITDYDAAAEALSKHSNPIKVDKKLVEAEIKAKKWGSEISTATKNKINWLKGFQMSNREIRPEYMPDQLNPNTFSGRSKLRTVGRLIDEGYEGIVNPRTFRQQITDAGYELPKLAVRTPWQQSENWTEGFYRAPVFKKAGTTPKAKPNNPAPEVHATPNIPITPNNSVVAPTEASNLPIVSGNNYLVRVQGNTPTVSTNRGLVIRQDAANYQNSRNYQNFMNWWRWYYAHLLPKSQSPKLLYPRSVENDGQMTIRFNKKGGKVVKAENGLSLTYSLNKPKQDDLFLHNRNQNYWTGQLKTPELSYGAPKDTYTFNPNRIKTQSLGFDVPNLTEEPTIYSKPNQYNPTQHGLRRTLSKYSNLDVNEYLNPDKSGSNEWKGTRELNLNDINPKPYLDIASLGVEINTANRYAKNMEAAHRAAARGAQKSMPIERYDSYSDNGLLTAYDNQILNTSRTRTQNADAKLRLAEQQMISDKVNQLTSERNQAYSQSIANWKANDTATKNKYDLMRREVADNNRLRWGELGTNLKYNEATRIATVNNSINSFLNQARDDVRRDQYERAQALASKQYTDDMGLLSNHYENFVKEGEAAWKEATKGSENWTDAQKAAFKDRTGYDYNDMTGYLSSIWTPIESNAKNIMDSRQVVAGYDNAPNRFGIRRQIGSNLNLRNWNFDNLKTFDPSKIIENAKKGGTIDYNEQALLNEQKEIHKALNKADDRLLKLLLKLLS